MWLSSIISIIIFYLLALLQTSFFAHFSFYGSTPNLVLIFLFFIIFFSNRSQRNLEKRKWRDVILAIIAGFILDVISSSSYFGLSVLLLSLLVFSTKKLIYSLKETGNRYSFIYFFPIFLTFSLIYDILVRAPSWQFSPALLAEIGYNSFVATIAFLMYKGIVKYFKIKNNVSEI